MSRSTDTLTKSTATDYKKMVSNGSIDSMDKSALGSETSYDIYESQLSQANGGLSQMDTMTPATTPGYNDILSAKYNEYSAQNQAKTLPKKAVPAAVPAEPKIYGLPEYNPQGFELAYRNEGFRDNSTYGGGTRSNSVSNYLNEETPIIHQTDREDANSDYYGNSSTLPMRAKGDNLSFLSELTQKLPDYEKLPNKLNSSFLPAPPDPPYDRAYSKPSTSNGYKKQVNSPSPTKNEYQQPEIRRPSPPAVPQSSFASPTPSTDVRRPQSYYTAMRSARESKPPSPPPTPPSMSTHRPKTVYEASGDDRRTTYSRSKSEALLETNFDEETSPPNPLTSDSRSYSQPLETAM